MAVLLDTNVLVRSLDLASIAHPACAGLLSSLRGRSHPLVVSPQNLIEFWVVATRPQAANGLGLSTTAADQSLRDLIAFIPVLPDPPDLFARWHQLVTAHAVQGKQAHDARLAAFMQAHSIRQMITLNAAHFVRFSFVECYTPADAGRRGVI